MKDNDGYKIPLAELLAILKTDGYEVSVERILEIESVLLSTSITKLNVSRLKYIIAPILARSDEDQENIYKIVDTYIAEKTRPVQKTRPAWMKHRYTIFGLKVAAFLVILAAAFFLYLSRDQKKSSPSIVNLPGQSVPGNTSDTTGKTNPAVDKIKPTTEKPPITAAVDYSGRLIVPERLQIILQIAAAFGLGFGGILYYFVFFERRKRMEAEKQLKDKEESFAAAKDDEEKASKQDVHAFIQFPEKNFLIQKTKEFGNIRANLKKPVTTSQLRLHVKESAYATTKNGGFPSLVFDNQLKERKYLLLVENKYEDGHINHLYNWLAHFLITSLIPVTRYTYTSDIRLLRDRANETVSLESLGYDYPDHAIIIIGDCRSFFDGDTPHIFENYLSLFQRWSSRSIITPVPLEDWSWQEQEVQQKSFNIVPAEIGAIELLTKSMSEDSIIKPAVLRSRIRYKYSLTKYNFNTAVQLRDYLDNEELFQVVCSLAVYPTLNWNLTLALFAALVKRDVMAVQSIKLDYDTLLKLARVPWLNSTRLDESIRVQLLNFLKPATEIIARETIIELLHEMNPFLRRNSPAYDELQVQLKINSFFLYAHDPYAYKQYAEIKNEFQDIWNNLYEWALKERVEGGLLPVTSEGIHETVDEFVLREKQFEKRNVTFLRLVLLVLPAAVLYILLELLRPPFVYLDVYKKVSLTAVVRKDASCQKEIRQVIIRKLDRSDTTELSTINNVGYFRIADAEYDRTVNVSLRFNDNTSLDVPLETRDSGVVISILCP